MDFRTAQAAEKPGLRTWGCLRAVPLQQGHPAPTATAPDTAPAGHAAPMDTTSASQRPSGHSPDSETEIGILIPEMRRLTRETPSFHILQGNACMCGGNYEF